MIDLHPSAESLLRQVVRAGPEGLVVPLDRYGDACALRERELARLSWTPRLIAQPTEKGRAYAYRSAA